MGNNRGYMLLGIVISIAILCFLLTPISISLVSSVWQSESAEKRLQALQLAQGKLEEVTAMKYEDIGPMERDGFPAPYGPFDYQVAVAGDQVYSLLKIVTVSVYYTDSRTGTEKTVALKGARAKR